MTSRTLLAALACALFACIAHADEVVVDVTFADGFDPAPPSVFRIGAVELRDPHVYLGAAPFCLDSTDTLNQQIQQQIDADVNGDGFYDASALAVFRPFDTGGLPAEFDSQDGDCTTAATPACTPGVDAPVVRWYQAFDLVPPTVCLGALADTTSGYSPPVPEPGGTCFATTTIDASIPFGTTSIPLRDTTLAAPWPAASGSTGGGLLRGFLRESDADQITFDFAGQTLTLASLLPDGSGSCEVGVQFGKDTDRGEPGWWMYLEYRLDAVSASGF